MGEPPSETSSTGAGVQEPRVEQAAVLLATCLASFLTPLLGTAASLARGRVRS